VVVGQRHLRKRRHPRIAARGGACQNLFAYPYRIGERALSPQRVGFLELRAIGGG
jgi:hypothetical protein